MTTHETFQQQFPIVLKDLADHMVTFGLPAPASIDVVDEIHQGQLVPVVRLYLRGEQTHLPWTASVAVDGESTEPMASGQGQRVEWIVRLPVSGARLRLVGFRAIPGPRIVAVA